MTLRPSTSWAPAAVLLVLAAGLAGCGDDTGSAAGDPTSGPSSTGSSSTAGPSEPVTTPTTEPAPTTSPTKEPVVRPACEEVWAGETLPAGYRGCTEGDRIVPAAAYPCSSGGRLIAYTNHYAIAGRVINVTEGPAVEDRAYGKAVQACSA